jgi:protein-disulfide isomerase
MRELTRLAAIAVPILLVVAVGVWLNGQGVFGPRFNETVAAASSGPPVMIEPSVSPPPSSGGPRLVEPDSPTITAPGAPVTIVEFLDFECEACGAEFPIVKRILAEYEGRVTYVVRDFPNHNNSVLAASAAYAAGEQDKYWQMYDLLFGRQTSWAERQASQADVFLGFAQELGLDMTTFRADFERGRYLDRIRRDFEAAQTLGVDATPTFFINGEKIVGVLSYEEFKRLIDLAMRAGS